VSTGTLWCPERKIYSLGTSDDRDAWLAARMTKLTASDLASVVGVGYRRRNEVLAEKLGEDANGKDDKVHAMAQVEAGRFLEDGIVDWYAAQTLAKVEKCGQLLYRDCSRPYIACTPDALVDGDPLEVKNVAQESQYNWALNTTPRSDKWPDHLPFPVPVHAEGNWAMATNKVAAKWAGTPTGAWREHFVKVRTELLPLIGAPVAPLKLVIQLYVQMFVLKRKEGVMTACIGGVNRLDLYFTMHEPTMQWLLEQADEFWREVQDRRL
jgi:hypothetical protein